MKYLSIIFLIGLCLMGSGYRAYTQILNGSDSATLAGYRSKIDSLDRQLIHLLGVRERVVAQVGMFKAERHIAPLQPARFEEVVKRAVAAGKKEGLSEEFVRQLMNSIHEESLRIEKQTQ